MKARWMEKIIGNKLRQAEESVDTDQIWSELEPRLPARRKRPILPILFFAFLLLASAALNRWALNEPGEALIPGKKNTRALVHQKFPPMSSKPETFAEIAATNGEKQLYTESSMRSTSSKRTQAPQNRKALPKALSKKMQDNKVHKALPTRTGSLTASHVEPVGRPSNFTHLDKKSEADASIALLPISDVWAVGEEIKMPEESLWSAGTNIQRKSIHFVEIRAGIGTAPIQVESNILPESAEVQWQNRHVQSYSALVGRHLSPTVGFSTGFQLTRWNQRFHYSTLREEERQQNNQLVATVLLVDGSQSEQYGILRQQETIRSSYQTTQELRTFELPLNLHVELFEKGRWRLVTLLTGIISWRQEIQGFFYPVSIWSDQEPELINRELSSSASYFQMAAGLGFAYKFNPNYSIYCYPQWRSGQQDLEIDESIEFSQEGGAVALQFGLRRNF